MIIGEEEYEGGDDWAKEYDERDEEEEDENEKEEKEDRDKQPGENRTPPYEYAFPGRRPP